MLIVLITYLVIINLITLFQFDADKSRSVTGGWRIPESRLLWLAFLGGSPAASAAQRWYRHKTKKQPFARLMNFIVFTHFVIIVLAALYVHWSFVGLCALYVTRLR